MRARRSSSWAWRSGAVAGCREVSRGAFNRQDLVYFGTGTVEVGHDDLNRDLARLVRQLAQIDEVLEAANRSELLRPELGEVGPWNADTSQAVRLPVYPDLHRRHRSRRRDRPSAHDERCAVDSDVARRRVDPAGESLFLGSAAVHGDRQPAELLDGDPQLCTPGNNLADGGDDQLEFVDWDPRPAPRCRRNS